MKRLPRSVQRLLGAAILWLEQFGLQPLRTLVALKGLGPFLKDRAEWRRQVSTGLLKDLRTGPTSPRLGEQSDQAGTMRGHYFHQDLLIARRIYEADPRRHIDIGSRTDGFVAHVAVFREIEILDTRPLSSEVENIRFRRADLMELPKDLVECTDSLSSLHAVEHFGLGRYGDPINVEGHVKALDNMHHMLEPKGTLYLSVPISHDPRVEFNSQRVLSIPLLLDLLEPYFDIRRFWYVDDAGDLVTTANLQNSAAARSFDCDYGCAIFELEKHA